MLISDGVIGLRPSEVAAGAAQPPAHDREPPRGPGTSHVPTEPEKLPAERSADGSCRTFAVVELSSNTLVGTLEIAVEPEFLMKRQADIGYAIHTRWSGGSVPGRAVVLGCRYLARHDLADEAVLRLDPEDKTAIALAHQLGFHYHHGSTEPGGPRDWFIQAV